MSAKSKIVSSANLFLIFECAGRYLNFSQAARELGVSQPAISHAIRKLEQQLGVRLFERQHRGVALTRAGKSFYQQVSRAINELYQAADSLRHQQQQNNVTLSVSTAFATYWLLPRIARFKQHHPGINLRCLTTETDDDRQQDIDLRIPLGGGDWPAYQRWHFSDESVVAVCSRAYLDRAGTLSGPQDLADQTLLHLEANYPQRLDWESWLRHFGVEHQPQGKQFSFNDYSVVLQAAMEDQGIALGWRHIVQPLINDGRLVQALDLVHTSRNPFYILAPRSPALSPATECLRNWLITEVNQSIADQDYR